MKPTLRCLKPSLTKRPVQHLLGPTFAWALCLGLTLLASDLLASPFDKKISFTQPDGAKVTLSGKGDEFYAVFETLDGYTAIFDRALKAYCFARRAADGQLASTGVQIHTGNPAALGLSKHERMSDAARVNSATQKRQRWEQDTRVQQRWSQRKAAMRQRDEAIRNGNVQPAPPATTTTGNKIGFTLMVDFSDDPGTISISNVVEFLNADNYTGYGNNGSVKGYFYDNSGGMLVYNNDVVGYVRVPHPKTYYNDVNRDCGELGNLLIKDALDVLKADPNYTTTILPLLGNLTTNVNNEVVACNVFFAGANSGVWNAGLWPHSWSLVLAGAQELSPGGMKIWNYQITDMGASLSIGTFCHENGHMLCDYPDIYDYTYWSVGGAGLFCLMNSGGATETNPTQICAYLKRASGWGTTVELAANSSITASVTASAGTNFNRFYRFQKPGVPTEYYIVENRQRINHDATLPAAGIAIWHVDELGDHNNSNLDYNSYHANYEVTLMQADNLWHFEYYINDGDAYDLFFLGNGSPGYANRFVDYSSPSARWWDGSLSGIVFTDFSVSAPTMTFRVGRATGPTTEALSVVSTSLLDGNSNGVVDVNETCKFWIVLRNDGSDVVSNINAVLTTTTPGVVVLQGNSMYPTLQPSQSASNSIPFVFYTTPEFLCGSTIDWKLSTRSATGSSTNVVRLGSGLIGLTAYRFNNDNVLPIPDFSSNGVESAISVAGLTEVVGKVAVSLYLTHPRDMDLTLELISPDGTVVPLARNQGGIGQNYGVGCGSGQQVLFDDNARLTLDVGLAPFVGTWIPDGSLSAFRGKSGAALNGSWRLRAADQIQEQSGSLQCWSLFIYPAVCSDGGGEFGTDLSIKATASPDPVVSGGNLVYGITITNNQPVPAASAILTNFVPTNVNLVSVSVSQGTYTNLYGTLIFNLGTISNGAVVHATIVVSPRSTGVLTNIFGVSAANGDVNNSNNVAVLKTHVDAPAPYLVSAGTLLTSESFAPPDQGISSGEAVTIYFGLRNVGSLDTVDLQASLQPGGGVVSPSGVQSYGAVAAFGAETVFRPFTFTAQGAAGSEIVATLQLSDGGAKLGNVSVSFPFTLSGSGNFVNGSSIVINDFAAASPYPSVINVSNQAGVVSKVLVRLNKFTHSFPADVDVLLVSPSGQSVILMSDAGGGQGISGASFVFDQDAALSLSKDGPLTTGTYKPTDYETGDTLPLPAPTGPYVASLDSLRGVNPNGAWRLYVVDDNPGDGGIIQGGWGLTLSTVSPVSSNANLSVTLVGSPASVVVGTPVTYTASVGNSGPDSASQVVLSNSIPADMEIVGLSKPIVGFDPSQITLAPGLVLAKLDRLAPGSNAVVTFLATPKTTGKKGVTATVGAAELDMNLLDNTAAVVTTSTNFAADLLVRMVDSPDPVVQGQPLTYTVSVTNQGPFAAAAVQLSVALHPGDSLVSVDLSQGSSAVMPSGRILCSFGDLAEGDAAVARLIVTPAGLGVHTASADASSSTVDPVSANNSASVATTVVAPLPKVVSSGVSLIAEYGLVNGAIEPGERVTLNLALRNDGTANTTNLQAALVAGNGVILSDGPQSGNYGSLLAGGASVGRSFTFQAASSGSSITAVLSLQDGPASLGTVSFVLPLSSIRQFASPGVVIINDMAAATPYPSVIEVSNMTDVATKVTVTLNNLKHGYPSDTKFLLQGPNGQHVVLMAYAGGFYSADDVSLTFDDDSSDILSDVAPLSSGTCQPTSFDTAGYYPPPAPMAPHASALAAFSGIVPNGKWSLFVADDVSGEAGRLNGGWSIQFITTRPLPESADLAVTSSFSPNPCPVGGLATITVRAVNYGPAAASGVVLSNSLPASFHFVSAVPSKGGVTRQGNLITCNVGALATGESFTLAVTGNPTSSGTTTNAAGIVALEPDANVANNLSLLGLVISAPVLNISRSGDTILVSWPNSALGYVLFSSLSVGPDAEWTPEDMSMVEVINGQNVMKYNVPDIDVESLFFRLVQQ